MAKLKEDKIFRQDNNELIELTGAELEAFEADREQMRLTQELFEAEYEAKRKAREDAIKKLAEIAGLTEAEINAIL